MEIASSRAPLSSLPFLFWRLVTTLLCANFFFQIYHGSLGAVSVAVRNIASSSPNFASAGKFACRKRYFQYTTTIDSPPCCFCSLFWIPAWTVGPLIIFLKCFEIKFRKNFCTLALCFALAQMYSAVMFTDTCFFAAIWVHVFSHCH